jgi:hypothetical protein
MYCTNDHDFGGVDSRDFPNAPRPKKFSDIIEKEYEDCHLGTNFKDLKKRCDVKKDIPYWKEVAEEIGIN